MAGRRRWGHLLVAHRGVDDAVHPAVQQGLRLPGAQLSVACRVQRDQQPVVAFGGFLDALDELAGVRGGAEVVGEESEGLGVPCTQTPGQVIRPVFPGRGPLVRSCRGWPGGS